MLVLQGDILEDIALIENLEETKRTAVDIAEKVKQAKETELSIGKAREVYRPVATRGSLVYFLIDTLNALDRCYHYSMANFVFILRKGERSCLLALHCAQQLLLAGSLVRPLIDALAASWSTHTSFCRTPLESLDYTDCGRLTM